MALEEVAREVSLLAQKHAYELELMFQRLQGQKQRLIAIKPRDENGCKYMYMIIS